MKRTHKGNICDWEYDLKYFFGEGLNLSLKWEFFMSDRYSYEEKYGACNALNYKSGKYRQLNI